MQSAVMLVQVMLMCTATVCWGSSCSSAGRCGIAMNTTHPQEAFELAMAKVRKLFPKTNITSSQGCQSKCLSNEVGGNSSLSPSEKVAQLIKNIKKLAVDIEAGLVEQRKEKALKDKVKEFSNDRDWPKLKAALEANLKPDDPALKQAQLLSWTDGKDAFQDIVSSKHTELLEKLLDLGLDVNLPWGPNNSTALCMVASTGSTDVAEILFSRGVLVDACDGTLTPLLRAAASHQPGMAKWLLDHGADPFATNKHGWTALHFAARENDLETVKVLDEGGVPTDTLNGDRLTARDVAEIFEYQDIVYYLAPQDPFGNKVNAQ